MGEGRQTIRDYIWCIQKTLERSNPVDFVGLPQAISKCRDERGLLLTSSLWATPNGTGAMPTDDVAENLNNGLPLDIPPVPTTLRKTLSALIFNEELPLNLAARAMAITLKTGFVTVFGDVAYDTEVTSIDPLRAASGARRGAVRRIDPTQGKEEYVDQASFVIMNGVSNLIRQFCVLSLAPPAAGAPIFDAERFWNNVDTQTYAALSAPGFDFTRATGNMFLRSFRNVMGPKYVADDCALRAGPPTGWESLIRAKRTGSTGSVIPNDEYLRLVYNFGQRLARARLYAIAQIAYAKLAQLTAAADGESSTAETGQILILSSLGLTSGESIKDIYENSIENLRAFASGQTEQDRNLISRSSSGSASVFGR